MTRSNGRAGLTRRGAPTKLAAPPPARSESGAKRPAPEPGSGFSTGSPRRRLVLCAGLVAAVLVVFGQAITFDFVSFDDTAYVTQNRHVIGGPTPEALAWALTTTENSNWHPLTWLSHMLDCGLYGLNPAGHHATSVLLHALSTILLFLLLLRMTGAEGPSAFVAALFGIHPLHVESVAWVAERKDVLSGLLWILTTLAYVAAVGRRSRLAGDGHADGGLAGDHRQASAKSEPEGVPRSSGTPSFATGRGSATHKGFLAAAIGLYALALMAKPMPVTLPFTLLLLDFWPLRRLGLDGEPPGWKDLDWKRLPGLVIEKLPFFFMAAASSVATFVAQRRGGSVSTLAELPLGSRAATALVAWVVYPLQALWPTGLSSFYPRQAGMSFLIPAGCALLLTGATIAVLRFGLRSPWLPVGWFWYLGTLVPVIGLVQVGEQARADRYTYIPLIGLFVLVAFEAARAARAWKFPAAFAPAAALVLVAALLPVSFRQARNWKDNATLFSHALALDPNNPIALVKLGQEAIRSGEPEEAERLLSRAHRALPDEPTIAVSRAQAMKLLGRNAEAEAILLSLVEKHPSNAAPYYMLGELYSVSASNQDAAAAERAYRKAIELEPESAVARAALAAALTRLGRTGEAAEEAGRIPDTTPGRPDQLLGISKALLDAGQMEKAARLLERVSPGDFTSATALNSLAEAFHLAGRDDRALSALDRADRISPALAATHRNRALLRRASGDLPGAESDLIAALALEPDDWKTRLALARLLALSGRLEEAKESCDLVLKADPSLAQAWFLRADLRMRLDDRRGAIEDFRQGLARDPHSAHGHYTLGLLLSDRGDHAEALDHFREAARLAPDNPDYARAQRVLRGPGSPHSSPP